MVSHFDVRFDFAVLDDEGNVDFFIEFLGLQHYEPSSKFGGKRGFYLLQFNDNKKRRYCKLQGIPLVEIPYYEENLLSYDYIYDKAEKAGY